MAGDRWGCQRAAECLCDRCVRGRGNLLCCVTHDTEACPIGHCQDYKNIGEVWADGKKHVDDQ